MSPDSEEHRQTEAAPGMDTIRHATAVFSPGTTGGGDRALAGIHMTGFRPVRPFPRRNREKRVETQALNRHNAP